jgi:hypothetical protein
VERLWLWSGAIVALLASAEKAKITVLKAAVRREKKVHRSKMTLVARATVLVVGGTVATKISGNASWSWAC